MKTTHKLLFILVLLITACKKDSDSPEPAPVVNEPTVTLSFAVDNQALLFDSILYTNAAGNNYSVTRLQFYLSAFEFENTDGTFTKFDSVIYVDALINKSPAFSVPKLPFGNYKSLKFLIGLDSATNIVNGLPNTIDNFNMVWPSFMGGGYHFMKLEGKFNLNATAYGYAMHVGRNANVVPINIVKNFSVSNEGNLINLKMNINEWYVNPIVYDFNVEGNHSMNDSVALSKLALNGCDVFTLN